MAFLLSNKLCMGGCLVASKPELRDCLLQYKKLFQIKKKFQFAGDKPSSPTWSMSQSEANCGDRDSKPESPNFGLDLSHFTEKQKDEDK
jgi:hypothetical protein